MPIKFAYFVFFSYICTEFIFWLSNAIENVLFIFKVMNKNILKLNLCYYLMMVLAVLSAVGAYLLIMHDVVSPVSPYSTLGQVLQYVVIFDALITIPGGLYLFKRACKRLSTMEDKVEQERLYTRYAVWRIVAVSNSMIPAVAAFYLMGAYQSMIWVAAIAAIGWYFTKPSEAKMESELLPEDPNQETY